MRTRPCLAALAGLLATLAVAAPSAHAAEIGVNETLQQTFPTADRASELGAGWVRLWASWRDTEPGSGTWDAHHLALAEQKVQAAKAKGLKVLMVVQSTPPWANGGQGPTTPPTDPASFGAAMGGFAAKLPGVDAWELWNEEDGAIFWAGGTDPAKYAAMVKAAYPAIKAAQPHDIVVTGATVGNNMDFIAQLYEHGIKGSFDAVGVHTDTACLINGPDVSYRDELGRVGRYSFTGYREVHAVMARNGDGAKPIWMTELGWNTQTTAPGSCNVGEWAGQKPLGVSEAEQAQFLTQAYQCLQADPIVGAAFWFGLQDVPGSQWAGGFGLYRHDGSAKPSAAAFRAATASPQAVPCGAVVDASGPEIQVSQPLDGAKFVDMIDIEAQGLDSPGGVGIARMKLYADGEFERTFGDGHASISPYWPSRYWKRGKHTLTFKAIDEANNVITKTVTVYKVKHLPKVKTTAKLALAARNGAKVRVAGGITYPAAHASTRLRGTATVIFQRKGRGKPKWRAAHRVRRSATRPISVTKRLAAGRWRIVLDYPGVEGFKKSRSKPLFVRIR